LDADFQAALDIQDRKEYNIRKRKPSQNMNEQSLLKKTGLIRNYNNMHREKNKVDEGFFDDWPEEIIKKYKLKVSQKKHDEIYSSNKRQKVAEVSDTKSEEKLKIKEKPVVPLKEKEGIKEIAAEPTKSNNEGSISRKETTENQSIAQSNS